MENDEETQALLSRIKEYAISNDDINKVLEPDTNIFSYPKFAEMSHIDEAFDPLGRCVFLFLTQSESMGHWLTMFKRDNNRTIEYFDSYAEKPEAQRKWISQEDLDRLGEDQPYLWNLLKKSGYRVYYNTVQYQSDREDISTCGRWCLARLICKDFSNKEFYNMVRYDMKKRGLKSYDDWVAIWTAEMIGK